MPNSATAGNAPDLSEEIRKAIVKIHDKAGRVRRLSSILEGDLDSGLSICRGTILDNGSIRLIFQERGIDDTMFLVGELNSEAESLFELIESLSEDVDQ